MSKLFLLSVNTFFWIGSSQIIDTIFCDKSYECEGQSPNATSVYIQGYKALFGSNSSCTATNYLYANGAYACDGASFLRILYYDVLCYGSGSCSNTQITSSFHIYCTGANACSFSTINGSELHCSGDQSCAHTIIDSMSLVHGRGAYSLYQATIINTNSETPSFYHMEGDYAAYGAKLTCVQNKTCIIHCFGFNSCTNFYIQCIGLCTVLNTVGSGPTRVHTIAPIRAITDFEPNASIMATAFEIDVQLITTMNEQLCNKSINITYDDDSKGITQNETVINTGSTLCCRGYSSCGNQHRIAYESVTNQSIVCSASLACEGVRNMDTNHGTLLCEGFASCDSSMITNTNIVYCIGAYGCRNAGFSKTRYVHCSGYCGCQNTTFASNGMDLSVYLTAKNAGYNARITCNYGDRCSIICRGFGSCGQTTTVICNGICNITNELGSNYLPTLIQNSTTGSPTQITQNPTGTPSGNPTKHTTTLDPSQSPITVTLEPSLFHSTISNPSTSILSHSTISRSVVIRNIEKEKEDDLFLIAVIAFCSMISLLTIYFMVRFICLKCIKPKHVENDVMHMEHNIGAINGGNEAHEGQKETDEGNPVIDDVELAMRHTRGEGSICEDKQRIVVDIITKGHNDLSNIEPDEFIVNSDDVEHDTMQ